MNTKAVFSDHHFLYVIGKMKIAPETGLTSSYSFNCYKNIKISKYFHCIPVLFDLII